MQKILLCYLEYNDNFYTPLDLAYAKTFLEKNAPKKNYQIEICRIKATIDQKDFSREAYVLASYQPDQVLFFLDNILWSMMFGYEGCVLLAKKLVQLCPQVKIGLQSYKFKKSLATEILQENPYIHFIIRGEPEIPLQKYLQNKTIKSLPNIFSEDQLIEDLDTIPSPYLSGTLDQILLENSDHTFFLTTSRGCPFQCHYCSRSVKFSKVRTFSVERFLDELQYISKYKVSAVFMLDDCFIVSRDRFWEMVEKFEAKFSEEEKKQLPQIMMMSRPEFLSEDVIESLPRININYVQIGLQTIHPDAQFLMGRGVSLEAFDHIVTHIQKQNIRIHLDVIIGLPHDDLKHCKKTIDQALALKVDSLQIKQLYRNPYTLMDLKPEDYGLKTEKKSHLFHVPFVTRSNTFSHEDIQKASEYAASKRENPHTKIKLVTQFHRFNDFGKR
jgi:radical SAM superfamily enzyme YgiQ (UPF0313 family)